MYHIIEYLEDTGIMELSSEYDWCKYAHALCKRDFASFKKMWLYEMYMIDNVLITRRCPIDVCVELEHYFDAWFLSDDPRIITERHDITSLWRDCTPARRGRN